jgi:hypothetical protein
LGPDVEDFQAASNSNANRQIVVWKNIIKFRPECRFLRTKTLFDSGKSKANSVLRRSWAKNVMISRNCFALETGPSLAPALRDD